jgi:hypothetical protein
VCFHQNFLFHFLLQYPNVEGPNSSVRCLHCGAQETLVPRDALGSTNFCVASHGKDVR